jgi:hypothetical protein
MTLDLARVHSDCNTLDQVFHDIFTPGRWQGNLLWSLLAKMLHRDVLIISPDWTKNSIFASDHPEADAFWILHFEYSTFNGEPNHYAPIQALKMHPLSDQTELHSLSHREKLTLFSECQQNYFPMTLHKQEVLPQVSKRIEEAKASKRSIQDPPAPGNRAQTRQRRRKPTGEPIKGNPAGQYTTPVHSIPSPQVRTPSPQRGKKQKAKIRGLPTKKWKRKTTNQGSHTAQSIPGKKSCGASRRRKSPQAGITSTSAPGTRGDSGNTLMS